MQKPSGRQRHFSPIPLIPRRCSPSQRVEAIRGSSGMSTTHHGGKLEEERPVL